MLDELSKAGRDQSQSFNGLLSFKVMAMDGAVSCAVMGIAQC